MRYRVQRGQVTARAGETTARSNRLAGHVDFDADAPTAAHAEMRLDMRSFSAGDGFAEYELGKRLDPANHPEATLTVARVESLREAIAGSWTGIVQAQLRWRGRQAMVRVTGKATVDRRSLELTAAFDFEAADLGAPAARVAVQITLFAVAEPDAEVVR